MPASASANFFDVSSKIARLAHTHKKTLDKNANIKKKKRIETPIAFGSFRHASRAKSARTTSSSSSSSPALDPLLRVLSAAKTKRCSARARVFCRKEKKGRQKIHTWEGRTRFLHRRSRRAIRAPPRTRGRRNRSSVRSQGSGRAFRILVLLLFLRQSRHNNCPKCFGETNTPQSLLFLSRAKFSRVFFEQYI